jgi:serine/threonine protein kinase
LGVEESSFGRYRLFKLIGQGGMGHVYRAFDNVTDRTVALKVLPPHLSDDHSFQQRFRHEAHAAARLTDPHVVPIHGYGEIDGRLYLDMRLIEGQDLGQILKGRHKPLDPALAVLYIEQVAEALDAAHTAGLIHRDVKPSNILITARDFVYLIDFGIARAADQTRVTSTGLAVGTFAYMSPERLTSDGSAEASSDIYALTCVLYECLTGRPPFDGESVEQQIAAHLMTPPPRPSDSEANPPVGFDAVIERGLAKDPSDRYQTALELADAARAALPRKRAGDAGKRGLAGTKPKRSERSSEALPSVSTSASTVLAPTMLADAARQSGVSASKERTGGEGVTRHPNVSSEGYVFWIVCSILLLISAAVLVAVFIGILTT